MNKNLEKKIAHFKRITVENNFYHPFVVFNHDSALVTPEDVRKKWDIFLRRNKNRYVSLYVNIPYCLNNKCNYCMYNSKILRDHSELDCYVDYLKGSMEFYDAVFQGYEFANMHIGGGTPTLLHSTQLETLFGLISQRYRFADNAMKTFEISPSSVTHEQLAAAAQFGINRITIGVQSFNEVSMELARRRFVPFEGIKALVEKINALGFQALNIDLIGGLPGDTPDDFRDSFQKAASLNPTSITTYFFRFENSRYDQAMKRTPGYGWGAGAIKAFMQAISDTAGAHRYVNESFSTQNLNNVFFRADYENRLSGYPTKWEPGLRNSCLGLGVGAKSSLLDIADMYDMGAAGQARYHMGKALDPAGLDIGRSRYLLYFFDNRTRLVNHFLRQLYTHGKLSLSAVENIYHVDLREYFREEFEILAGLGKLRVEGDTVCFTVEDEIEWGVYSKFFYDERTIEEMAKHRGGSRYSSA